jgi:hypothetical protein
MVASACHIFGDRAVRGSTWRLTFPFDGRHVTGTLSLALRSLDLVILTVDQDLSVCPPSIDLNVLKGAEYVILVSHIVKIYKYKF